jgi:uncharacterized protein YndB with AHSA1/START domain
MAPAPAIRARIQRRFTAQAEDVFDAWIDPAKVRHWFGPGLGEMAQIDIDPRVGGTFCLVQRRKGADAPHTGEYTALERPRRLAFTWRTPPLSETSRVTIDIVPAPDGCELTLTHEMDARWAAHLERIESSWRTMADALASVVEPRA